MEDERPFPEYAALAGTFGAVLAGFVFAAGPRLPERIPSPTPYGSASPATSSGG